MCRADPPGWRNDHNGSHQWYAGGSNYNRPHVWVNGTYNEQPIDSCTFCGITKEVTT